MADRRPTSLSSGAGAGAGGAATAAAAAAAAYEGAGNHSFERIFVKNKCIVVCVKVEFRVYT